MFIAFVDNRRGRGLTAKDTFQNSRTSIESRFGWVYHRGQPGNHNNACAFARRRRPLNSRSRCFETETYRTVKSTSHVVFRISFQGTIAEAVVQRRIRIRNATTGETSRAVSKICSHTVTCYLLMPMLFEWCV